MISPSALRRSETLLTEYLGTRVRLSEQRGTGTIQITYHGAEDLVAKPANRAP